jgi:hypothetical protein
VPHLKNSTAGADCNCLDPCRLAVGPAHEHRLVS